MIILKLNNASMQIIFCNVTLVTQGIVSALDLPNTIKDGWKSVWQGGIPEPSVELADLSGSQIT